MPDTTTAALPIPRLPAGQDMSLLVRQADAPAVVGVSRTRWFALKGAGLLPLPVAVPGGEVMYRRRDLQRWVDGLRPVRRGRSRGHVAVGGGDI